MNELGAFNALCLSKLSYEVHWVGGASRGNIGDSVGGHNERYVLFANQADTKAFSESNLKGTMEKYLNILNIIGKRLVDFPEANIRIVGCNSNFREERGKIDLSRSRAERIRAYLKYIWGIDSSRMTVEARNLPAVATTNRLSEGRAENQRVEIYSDFPAILDPIKSTYVEEISDTEELRIFTRIQAGYGTASWKLQLMGDGDPIESLEGEGEHEATPRLG